MIQTQKSFWNFIDSEWRDKGLTNEDSFFKPSWNILGRIFVLFLILFWTLLPTVEALALHEKHKTIVFVAEDFLGESLSSDDRNGQLLLKTLYFLPQSHYQSLSNVSLQYDVYDEPRGRANASKVILNKKDLSESELVSVFIHEIGHVADLGMLKSVSKKKTSFTHALAGDPSILFYSVAWDSNNEKKDEKSQEFFVSGYSLSNPYEDFAESYDFYLLHGDEFRKRMQTNTALKERYNFLKRNVFFGKEFSFGDDLFEYPKSFFDVTKLSYDFPEFLAEIDFSEAEEEDERVRRQKRKTKRAPRRVRTTSRNVNSRSRRKVRRWFTW